MHHTAERAIEKNAHEACGCGTDTVYVMSRSEPMDDIGKLHQSIQIEGVSIADGWDMPSEEDTR